MPEITVVRHPRARRYVLRLTLNGGLRLTVPRRGSIEGGLRFVAGQTEWIERERARVAERVQAWTAGTEIWWRGDRVRLTWSDDGRAMLCGEQRIAVIRTTTPRLPVSAQPSLFDPVEADTQDVRAEVESHLRKVATRELPPRLLELARLHAVSVSRVFVRNQRARWGACSSTGTITLNWRLLQLPDWVADYVLFHELMHRRQPNHSRRFWREVASVCPDWRDAERWIKKHGRTIL